MEFNEAKAVLKKGYLAAGLELVDEESSNIGMCSSVSSKKTLRNTRLLKNSDLL